MAKIEWTINIKKIGDATVTCTLDKISGADNWTLNFSGKPIKCPSCVGQLLVLKHPENVIE